MSQYGEPWEIRDTGPSLASAYGMTPQHIIVMASNGQRLSEKLPYEQRAVSAVNACAGIPDEVLERINQLGGFWDAKNNSFNPHLP